MSAHRELRRIKLATGTGVDLAVGVALELAEGGLQIGDQIVAILDSD